jgi:hypothetical protein
MKEEVMRIYKVPSEKIVVVSADSETWIGDILKLYSSAVLEATK